jgi:hypothetical protein
MADTQRTKSALLTLLANNGVRGIDSQDLRDLVESLRNRVGSFYFTTPAATSFVNAYSAGAANRNMVKGLGTTTGITLDGFTHTNNRLTYSGVAMCHAHCAISLSWVSSTNNIIAYLGAAKNGTLIAHSVLANKLAIAGDEQSTALHFDTMLSTNDYLEIFVGCSSIAATITINNGYIVAMTMIM